MIALLLLALAGPQTSTAARFQHAQALAATGRYELAAAEFRQAAEAQPANPRAWYALGRAWVGAASESYVELLGKAPPDSPYVRAVQADGLMRRMQYPAAIAGFRAALAQQPDLVSAHTALAAMYAQLGRQDWAAKERAANAGLGCASHPVECDFLAGKYDAVLRATAAGATDAALYWHGQAATGLGRRAFNKLEQLPPSVELHKYRAGVHWEADRRLDVVQDLRAALKLAPADRDLRQQLASALGAAGFFEEAYALVHALLRDAPDSAQLNALAGTALLSMKNAEEAIPFLKKSVALEPRNLEAQSSLGRAYMDTGDARLALPFLEAATRVDSDGSLHHLLATAYRRTGQPRLAEEAMAKSRELAARSAKPPAQLDIPPP